MIFFQDLWCGLIQPIRSANGNQSHPVKLIGVVSYGDPPPCGLAGAYASVASVVEWINEVTRNCNKLTCALHLEIRSVMCVGAEEN